MSTATEVTRHAGTQVARPLKVLAQLIKEDLEKAPIIAAAHEMLEALKEIETICTESAGDCRRRMGTRVGNALVTARAAIAKAEGK